MSAIDTNTKRTVEGMTIYSYTNFFKFLFGEKPIKKGWSDNLQTFVFYFDEEVFNTFDEESNEKRKDFALKLESHFKIRIKTLNTQI